MTGYLYRGRPGLEELNARIMAERALSDYGGRPPVIGDAEPAHGTEARARQHRREGGKPCASCLAAERAARRLRAARG